MQKTNFKRTYATLMGLTLAAFLPSGFAAPTLIGSAPANSMGAYTFAFKPARAKCVAIWDEASSPAERLVAETQLLADLVMPLREVLDMQIETTDTMFVLEFYLDGDQIRVESYSGFDIQKLQRALSRHLTFGKTLMSLLSNRGGTRPLVAYIPLQQMQTRTGSVAVPDWTANVFDLRFMEPGEDPVEKQLDPLDGPLVMRDPFLDVKEDVVVFYQTGPFLYKGRTSDGTKVVISRVLAGGRVERLEVDPGSVAMTGLTREEYERKTPPVQKLCAGEICVGDKVYYTVVIDLGTGVTRRRELVEVLGIFQGRGASYGRFMIRVPGRPGTVNVRFDELGKNE